MSLQEVYEQEFNRIINEIRMDYIDHIKAPPIETSNMTVAQCTENAIEYHKSGNVAAYLYFLVTANIKKVSQ